MGGVGGGGNRKKLPGLWSRNDIKGEGRSEDEMGSGKGFPYQVLSHGLCPNIYGETAQLRGVLKFTIEGPQVHWKNVVFRKSRFLKK